jgi:hypothetical protein
MSDQAVLNQQIDNAFFDLESNIVSTKVRALQTLARVGDDKIIPRLKSFLILDEFKQNMHLNYTLKKVINDITRDSIQNSGVNKKYTAILEKLVVDKLDLRDKSIILRIYKLYNTVELKHKLELLKKLMADDRSEMYDQNDLFAKAFGKTLNEETNDFLISALVKIVGKCKIPKYLKFITKYLTSDDDRVRANTLEGLSNFQKEHVGEIFLKLIDDKNSRVANNSISAVISYDIDYLIKNKKNILSIRDEWKREKFLNKFFENNINKILNIIIEFLVTEESYKNCQNIAFYLIENNSMEVLSKIDKLKISDNYESKKMIIDYLHMTLSHKESSEKTEKSEDFYSHINNEVDLTNDLSDVKEKDFDEISAKESNPEQNEFEMVNDFLSESASNDFDAIINAQMVDSEAITEPIVQEKKPKVTLKEILDLENNLDKIDTSKLEQSEALQKEKIDIDLQPVVEQKNEKEFNTKINQTLQNIENLFDDEDEEETVTETSANETIPNLVHEDPYKPQETSKTNNDSENSSLNVGFIKKVSEADFDDFDI